MLARVYSSVIQGADVVPVEVQVRTGQQGRENSFIIVGLADTAVRESRERVATALLHCGFHLPRRVLVNLAPAEIKKEGAAFDLAIAAGILSASGQVASEWFQDASLHGELSLDGQVKRVRGAVALALGARHHGQRKIIVPEENLIELGLIQNIELFGISALREVLQVASGEKAPASIEPPQHQSHSPLHFSEVVGQQEAKRALVIAAAGGHNVLMIGPPGCGKSMLAARFPSILPRLQDEEMLDAMRIHSIAGLDPTPLLGGDRPFRAPHHGTSEAGLIGGGSYPAPGEISLAHQGVLFLDEFPEYRRAVLEALRAPLESGEVRISRAKASVSYPARFQLIAAMNPCPCGRLGAGVEDCLCSPYHVQNYLRKLSQPILDRIDLHVSLERVPVKSIVQAKQNYSEDAQIRASVLEARDKAVQRAGKHNALLSMQELETHGAVQPEAKNLLEQLAQKTSLSARGVLRVLRVARTVADLEDKEELAAEHIAEASRFRALDVLRQYCQTQI